MEHPKVPLPCPTLGLGTDLLAQVWQGGYPIVQSKLRSHCGLLFPTHQDEMEFGYIEAPHKSIPVVFDSPRNRGLKNFPYKKILVCGRMQEPWELLASLVLGLLWLLGGQRRTDL